MGLSGQYKWNFDRGESHVVGSQASDRPVRESQANLFQWGQEVEKWQVWVQRGRRGPTNAIPVQDMEWVRDVASRYGFSDLVVPDGSVMWERDIRSIGGRCFVYPDGSWAIGLSLPRHQVAGRKESEATLAHELLHAYLWQRHRIADHGSTFKTLARARGIPRYCQSLNALKSHQQLKLAPKSGTKRFLRCRYCSSQAQYHAMNQKGRLVYVCQGHFAAHGCLLGDGLGKGLQVD